MENPYKKKLRMLSEQWKSDCKIDETELGQESIRTFSLHAKYVSQASEERVTLSKLKLNLKVLERKKTEWYSGRMSKEELDNLGWEPFKLKLLKNDIDRHVHSDDEYLLMEEAVVYQQEIVTLIESIVKSIDNRNYAITNAVNWTKFTKGYS